STEGKAIVEDNLAEVGAGLIAAYDSGEFASALDEGSAGWQKWVKRFGKSLNRKGKSLFMPLRMLLTGKLHGPDIGSTLLLLYKAGKCNAVSAAAGFTTLDERFRTIRELDWDSLKS
ncbi:hypothetical protein M569_13912, partial [Genlisea aurea]